MNDWRDTLFLGPSAARSWKLKLESIFSRSLKRARVRGRSIKPRKIAERRSLSFCILDLFHPANQESLDRHQKEASMTPHSIVPTILFSPTLLTIISPRSIFITARGTRHIDTHKSCVSPSPSPVISDRRNCLSVHLATTTLPPFKMERAIRSTVISLARGVGDTPPILSCRRSIRWCTRCVASSPTRSWRRMQGSGMPSMSSRLRRLTSW